ncbi:Dolichyl pyrophosphate Man9GlcNAc2 alpha-1,3-glucosyltransferase [Frankliniella fusca]|uniref:dolichyl-P-Glc:Man9GlcNAc2-PP-dolichol alpha-1,3-glucosyltransferase n=1 Tax=Frankliniella fusca TaxID=407009 RepID=A0AAE1HTY6_9NEOP|nr:Dolichyl pyrophosphate Man9GlcNAc2 alpha-1,3-glucosyltransferase [Frankliniella fusca]
MSSSSPVDSFRGAAVLTLLGLLVLRWAVALHSYSGEKRPPMYGDYEAQRHWMEVTHNLPVGEWYFNTTENDLMYWGLDYPPLTAYHSKVCGFAASLIDKSFVALKASRGFESYHHKLFMRWTVILSDLVVLIPSVWLYFAKRLWSADDASLVWIFLVLSHPGLLLIDHGHFQYNGVSIGLTIAAVAALLRKRNLLCSALFVLALNFKQMSLYYALPFFFYLLGTSLQGGIARGIPKVGAIGMVVLATFTIIWLPFVTQLSQLKQVLHRLFPIARGIFEDKVSNIWCALNVVYKIKNSFSNEDMAVVCLVSTLVVVIPSSLNLLFRPHPQKFVYSLINSSLAFFLFSFQVHEKSILLAAIPVSLILPTDPFISMWFTAISSFSMLPLLLKDGLLIPTIALILFHIVATTLMVNVLPSTREKSLIVSDQSSSILWWWAAFFVSMIGCVILTLSSIFVKPPNNLPDLFPLLISVYSCLHFIIFLLYFNYKQMSLPGVCLKSLSEKNLSQAQGADILNKHAACDVHVTNSSIFFPEVVDESNGCGGQFSVTLVSDKFEGKSRLQRHQLVHSILAEELKVIHAFSQKTLTPEQWETQKTQ